jgi:hypothetical protein
MLLGPDAEERTAVVGTISGVRRVFFSIANPSHEESLGEELMQATSPVNDVKCAKP